jgi:hypothetical protein
MDIIKLEFYVPETHLEEVKTALFEAGAGRIGDYDCCCWETLGNGQFRPLDGSKPFIGEQGRIEVVSEYKVEMVCPAELIEKIVNTLKEAHPYETPAYDYWEVKS